MYVQSDFNIYLYCWVGKQFYDVLVYADDIKLLAPSLTALQSMVDICKRFADKNGLFKENNVY